MHLAVLRAGQIARCCIPRFCQTLHGLLLLPQVGASSDDEEEEQDEGDAEEASASGSDAEDEGGGGKEGGSGSSDGGDGAKGAGKASGGAGKKGGEKGGGGEGGYDYFDEFIDDGGEWGSKEGGSHGEGRQGWGCKVKPWPLPISSNLSGSEDRHGWLSDSGMRVGCPGNLLLRTVGTSCLWAAMPRLLDWKGAAGSHAFLRVTTPPSFPLFSLFSAASLQSS